MVLVAIAQRLLIGDLDATSNNHELADCGVKAVVTCGALSLPWCRYHQTNGFSDERSCAVLDHAMSPRSDPNPHVDYSVYNHPYSAQTPSIETTATVTSSSIHHLTLDLVDSPDTDLLCHLDDVMDFIDTFFSQSQGNLLIHCWAGRSRSAAVAVAYLMRRWKKGLLFCLECIKLKYPQAVPNNGFIKQLSCWERLGYEVKHGTSSNHIRYRMTAMAKARSGVVGKCSVQFALQDGCMGQEDAFQHLEGPMPENDATPITQHDPQHLEGPMPENDATPITQHDPQHLEGPMQENDATPITQHDPQHLEGPMQENDPTPTTQHDPQHLEGPPLMIYRCRMCRSVLFDSSNIISCEKPITVSSQRAFIHKKNASDKALPQPFCTSVFVERMEWMQPVTDDASKLICCNPNCQAKLGRYSWYGCRCSCGNWQTPAFQIHLSKVDKLPASVGKVDELMKLPAIETVEERC